MKVLLIFCLQNDFCSFGNMQTDAAELLIEKANVLMPLFDFVLAINIAYPPNHISFAANHLFRQPGKSMMIEGKEQFLKPIHCVDGSFGAEFPTGLNKSAISKMIKIGQKHNVNIFSAFRDAEGQNTELGNYLKDKATDRIFMMGIGGDIILNSIMDAIEIVPNIFLIDDALAENLSEKDQNRLKAKGIGLVKTYELKYSS